MLKFFENLSLQERVILTTLVTILVGYSQDAEVLALLPKTVSMLIQKAVIYGGGGTILYKMNSGPKQ